jgi:hypothetical protein
VLGTSEIQELAQPDGGRASIKPQLAQFLPHSREPWVDYLTWEQLRFRLRLKLSDNGEKFHLVNVEEHKPTIANALGGAIQNRYFPRPPATPTGPRH